MKQRPAILILTLTLLALPAWGQAKKGATEKKAEQKTKQAPPDQKASQAVEQNNRLQSPAIDKGGKQPSGNQPANNLRENSEAIVKAVKLEILEVLKEDAKARPSTNAKERLVPVLFKWKGQSVNNGRLVELEVVLETDNTDGTKSRVAKKILDLSVDKLIAETILLPMKEGTFARSFKLNLQGKCASGAGAKRQEAAISAVKQGSFPLPK